ncbi:hypothetical protein INT43_008377 [Umbelopsis isabellina]|uniref:Uncharacterized protein n=1 Tax=Mortierella isabellina TaxID=91625 RepID=A0A8H7PV50_MORIS|nr:hypothetical protein INT43_008377 [Umbelopsis isabellina]
MFKKYLTSRFISVFIASYQHQTLKMKFAILSTILALSTTMVSAGIADGTFYVYANNVEHPKTTFLKLGSHNHLVTDGAACKGKKTLKGTHGTVSGTFIEMKNQWNFTAPEYEIKMGYVQVGDKCLQLSEDKPLSLTTCPSFKKEIKAGNKFAWLHDTRGSGVWAYGGNPNAENDRGIALDTSNLQSNGETLKGVRIGKANKTGFIGLGHVNLGNNGATPTGCQ